MEAPLLQTKLYIPPIRTDAQRVSRSRLIEQLNAGIRLGRSLTLVSAPAGFGKTTCISEWSSTLAWPTAWLSLDQEDDDPGRFFAYLVAALQKVDENLGREIEGVLRSGQLPPGEIISTILINDTMALNDRFLLVLDDLHVIQDRFILQVLEKWVINLPQLLHMVLITREDPPLPLARLRASNQLTEIRAGELRFTNPEADRFLNEAVGLSLSQTDIALLGDKTEGWIAGLQLAAIAMAAIQPRQPPSLPTQTQTDLSRFIATLSGNHRFILSYLTDQVLDRQPEEVQQYLLQTSILDKLTGDLCDAVTGRSDSRALLERLFNTNLFLIPLDDEQQWYRYHHLFADLLRDLSSVRYRDKTAELHQRASLWYAQAGGDRGTFVHEAMHHALAARDYELAVSLLESHAMGMIMQGYVKTVNGWAQAIPAEWRQSPKTDLAFAWMHLLRGAYAEVSPYLERLQATLGSYQAEHPQLGKESSSLDAEWLVMQSLMMYGQGKMTESITLAARALEVAPKQDSRVRSLAHFALASACQSIRDYPRAVEAYQMAVQHSRTAENLVAEMMGTIGLSGLLLERGQLHMAFEIASQTIERIERSGVLPPISAVVYGALGDAYYQWFQLDQAHSHIQRALELSRLGDYNTGTIFCQVLLSRQLQMEGDLEAAADEVQKAIDLVPVEVPDYVRQEVTSRQVRIYLAQHRFAAAQMALQGQGFSFENGFSFPVLPSGQGVSYSMGTLYNSSLYALLYQVRAKDDLEGLESGLELANRLIADAFQDQQLLIALEALLLRAQVYAALGGSHAGSAVNLNASQADYIRALELAEPEGFIGVFVEQGPPAAEALAELIEQNRLGTVQTDYVERILAAFSSLRSPATMRDEQHAQDRPVGVGPAALVEPLTDRELEVLGLMAKGLRYKEIAAKCFISLNTVRFHVKTIYGKLEVNNRTKAVEKARQLRIL